MEPGYAFMQFYVSLVTYTMLHMIFVISSDFVDAFNIPPLNIGIYVDKLAAIRALLMVIADILEYYITQELLHDGAHQQDALQKLGKDGQLLKQHSNPFLGRAQGCRRLGSLLSFLAMLICRIAYLIILYKSDNKSLSVFIVLCIEGFWFGTFQMGFFAIGPEYNAFTSLGIHTMGNFIFFLQLIMQHYAKKYPSINCLYRVRIHGWICLVTSVIALICWLVFTITVSAEGEDAPSEWPQKDDVWSPFWLFIVGAFAEDFAVPGILPFAFLDPERANLVNYMTPLFFMSGAIVTLFANDIFAGDKGLGTGAPDLKFKDWSAASAGGEADAGKWWHGMWALNVPKYLAFFISMFGIHGTFGRLRCIVQSRWRVMLLTMLIVVNRATLETMGYVGVANWAIGRADYLLGGLPHRLNLEQIIKSSGEDNADAAKTKIENHKSYIVDFLKIKYQATVKDGAGGIKVEDGTGTGGKLKVEFSGTGDNLEGESSDDVHSEASGKNIKLTIKIKEGGKGSLPGGSAATTQANAILTWLKASKISVSSNSLTGTRDTVMTALEWYGTKKALAAFLKIEYGAVVESITVTDGNTSGQKLEVKFEGGVPDSAVRTSTNTVYSGTTNNIKLEIKIKTPGTLPASSSSGGNNDAVANKILERLVKALGKTGAKQDFNGFSYIAYHDMLAMFCRFVYGKFAVGYNWTKGWVKII